MKPVVLPIRKTPMMILSSGKPTAKYYIWWERYIPEWVDIMKYEHLGNKLK